MAAAANLMERSEHSINLRQWLQNAKLPELESTFVDNRITIKELMELSDDELLEFANDKLKLRPLKRNRFIKAIKQSIALSAAHSEATILRVPEDEIDDAGNLGNDDEKKVESKDQEDAILKTEKMLKSASNKIVVNLEKIKAFFNEETQIDPKQRQDAIHQVFKLFATKLMDRKSKLIEEFNASTEEQVAAIKAFQSEMKAFKQSIEQLNSLKDDATVIAKQKELIASRYDYADDF